MIELASLGFGASDKKHFDLDLRCCTIVNNRQDACSTKSAFSCGAGILLTGVGFLQLGGVTSIKGIHRSVREG
ncbi:hypothetical protein QUB75_30215, partial [Microcoleus sp. K1-B6]|uniref:hypothetical protein n=1 Tax=unclassified Microcoleus TaxID=2642155 RepID=UPI002FD20AB0